MQIGYKTGVANVQGLTLEGSVEVVQASEIQFALQFPQIAVPGHVDFGLSIPDADLGCDVLFFFSSVAPVLGK